MSRLILAAIGLGACGAPTPAAKPGPDQLADELRTLAGAAEPTRRDTVASWRCDHALWDRTLMEPHKRFYAEYSRAFDAAVPALAAALARAGTITVRPHFGGDPRLTNAQSRDRWALPPQYPSFVAELDGVPIDTVFVRDRDHWCVLSGLDDVVSARVDALDHACAARFALAGPIGRCSDIGWVIADSALRSQRERFDHACMLAVTLCGTR